MWRLLKGYGFAAAVTALAIGVRWLTQPMLSHHLSMGPTLAAVMVVAWWGGFGPAILTLVLGSAAVVLLAVHSGGPVALLTLEDRIVFGSYLAVGLMIAVLTEFLRRARSQAAEQSEARATVQQQLHERLEQVAEAETRVQAVIDHVIDGIITINERGIVETVNPAAEQIFGYQADEVIGHNVKMLMPEPYHSGHDGYVSNYIHTGVAKIIGIGREVMGRRKDGSTFPMELAVSEFRLGSRRLFAGIVRDISERKRISLENERLLAEVKEADRRKDEFLAMLAHELRNPMAPIRSGLDLLDMEGCDAQTALWARNMMKQQVLHLVRLVDDLLDVSRIMRGKIQIRKERVQLAEVVARSVETARPLIDLQNHELTVLLPEKPVWLEADPVRLAQVLTNLLNNAAKYNDKAGHILLRAEHVGNEVILRVRDDGIGIDRDLLPHVFDLFTQADRSVARSHGGLGIGLTLVRTLIEQHGGSVQVHSEGPGRGSEFVVRLPALVPQPPEANGRKTDGRPSSDNALHRRVLVVDDNVDAARAFAEIASLWKHEVQVAHSGTAALELARTYHPDIILLDIGLPGMSGYDVAKALRHQPEFAKTLLVAVTGYGQEEDRRRSREAGFNHHLVKPVAPDILSELLNLPTATAGTP